MSRRTLALLLVGFFAVTCCASAALSGLIFNNTRDRMYTDDPKLAAQIGQKIAHYTLPDGYVETGALDVFYQIVVIRSYNFEPDMLIMLMSYPVVGASRAEMRAQLERQLVQQNQSGVEWETVGTRDVEVNAQTVTFTQQEGTSFMDHTMHREIGTYTTSDGRVVMIAITGSKAGWDDVGVDTFLASIH